MARSRNVEAVIARLRRGVGARLRVAARPLASLKAARDPNLGRAFPGYRSMIRRYLVDAVVVLTVGLVLGYLVHWAIFAVLVGVILAVAIRLRWRARPSYGANRGWPPGSLGVGAESFVDPDHFLTQAARFGPVFKSNHFVEPVVCVVGVEAATELLGRDHLDDLSPVPGTYNRFVPGGMFRWREGANSSAPRLTFTRALSLRFVAESEPKMWAAVQAEAERMVAASAQGGIDPVPHIREMVLAAWSPMFLGIAPDSAAYAEVRDLFTDLHPYRTPALRDEEVIARLGRMEALVRDADEAGDCSSTFVQELIALQPDALEDTAIVRNLVYTTMTTREDVTGLLAWVLKNLGDHPETVAQLRADPEGASDLADRIVSESIRLEQSEYLFRRIKRDIEFRGFVLPEGWLLRACMHESHRDPVTFDDPDRFIPDRFEAGRYRRDAYAPFGVDPRACTGDTVTRRMARIFVLGMADAVDWTVTADGPRELSRERHWAPSSAWRVRVTARAGSAGDRSAAPTAG